MNKHIAVLIMAAGKASRFGSCKQLANVDEYFNNSREKSGSKTVLQHAIDIANQQFTHHVFVVTGCYHQQIAEQIEDAQLIYNPDWESGLGVSIAHGVRELTKESENSYDGILILLADQIAINTSHLVQLYQGFNGENIVCARYQKANGVPALFPKSYFKYLQELSGDKGAKKLLNKDISNELAEIVSVDMPEALIDIDTPDDLKECMANL